MYRLFEKAGFPCGEMLEKGRKLVLEDENSRVRYFLVKPTDVDIYVEHGAADIGVVGKDVLMESGADVLELLDLQLGKCRLAVAGRQGFCEDAARPLRVATKYPAVARAYYAAHSRSVEIIKLHGSIELAPLLGLADVIVDIVETGKTLKENDLVVLADIAPSSARLIANRAAWRFKEEIIRTLAERLGEIVCK
ncbi:ATP phosphoribosyltransferase [Ruminococcaceae bacterium OttesenSCG-928-O06]|nr:ATP phosphoribosyltransferase [Ruminococcaceae bacterium OttesenSCG-928-O06]